MWAETICEISGGLLGFLLLPVNQKPQETVHFLHYI